MIEYLDEPSALLGAGSGRETIAKDFPGRTSIDLISEHGTASLE